MFFATYFFEMFALKALFFAFLCKNLIKEMILKGFVSLRWKFLLEIFILLYFLILYLVLKGFSFISLCLPLPFVALLLLYFFFKRREEKDLLDCLFSLTSHLEVRMKQGLSFIHAWEKALDELKGVKRNKMQKITQILKFEGRLQHPDKEIENFVKDLILIHQSSNPLQRLQHLQRKLRLERSFKMKSKRALFQIRLQSGLLSIFYFSLLLWSFIGYGMRHIGMAVVSLLLFSLGFFWILKTGRKMKWSV